MIGILGNISAALLIRKAVAYMFDLRPLFSRETPSESPRREMGSGTLHSTDGEAAGTALCMTALGAAGRSNQSDARTSMADSHAAAARIRVSVGKAEDRGCGSVSAVDVSLN